YFYAELERLVRLLEAANNNPNTLVLLDEILKGTNSSDKEAGSRAFVKKLIGKHVLTMVATHDTSLCSLEDEFHREVKNAHFASAVGQGDLVFDYTLRAGVCTSMNATWLMTSMGIIDND
ncbi:MAG: hypothetical protein RL226_1740, partial [Bacteroidota bacterium]